jgi:hypothetical protein
MTKKSRHNKRKAEVSLVMGMLVTGFVMVAWSMAISIGAMSPV